MLYNLQQTRFTVFHFYYNKIVINFNIFFTIFESFFLVRCVCSVFLFNMHTEISPDVKCSRLVHVARNVFIGYNTSVCLSFYHKHRCYYTCVLLSNANNRKLLQYIPICAANESNFSSVNQSIIYICHCPDHQKYPHPLELHLTTSELWFGQEQEGILPQLLSSSFIV